MLIALAINHAGYRGGGADDWHYLEAARCVAGRRPAPGRAAAAFPR
jgi:hypothetical protein